MQDFWMAAMAVNSVSDLLYPLGNAPDEGNKTKYPGIFPLTQSQYSYYYNKATDPFERRGAMALYRMMCWAPISISIGSSLYGKKGNKEVRSQEEQSYILNVTPGFAPNIRPFENHMTQFYYQYKDRQKKNPMPDVLSFN